jgi:hypothetical protein
MKKGNISALSIVLGCVLLALTVSITSLSAGQVQEALGNDDAAQQDIERDRQREIVIKTYHLKFINPYEIKAAAKFYLVDSTVTRNTITIQIRRYNIPKFEELLNKLDVEKKTILFKVFTVIASRQELKEKEDIENKDLKRVLNELESLWKFRSYKVDGPSFLTVKDGSGDNFFKLVSTSYNLNMHILHVSVKGDEEERIVSVGQIQLKQIPDIRNKVEHTLINTQNVTLEEKGYLVAGISGIGTSGNALILVISAEIK